MEDRWQQVKELFDAASERKPAEREAFLAEACGNDDELRAEVESLLAADEQAGSFMAGPVLGPAARPLFDKGALVADRYRIIRFLAQGGMGEVYEAEDLQLRERVALKTIRPALAADADALARFKQEVQLARKVTHRHVCRIFDMGVHRWPDHDPTHPEQEITFLTMELLAGETLQEYIRRRGLLPLGEAVPIIHQLVEGLRAAHQAKVLHLDFKSGNVILVPTAEASEPLRAVITDFGLSRVRTAETGGDPSLPSGAQPIGTPSYMAPEQLDGGPLTEAVDVHALGVVIYEMITGRNPFKADSLASTVDNVRHKDPDPMDKYISGVPAQWEAVVKKMLAKDPAGRYATMAEVAAELDAIMQGPALGKKTRVASASLLRYLLAGLLALLMISFILWRIFRSEPALVFTDKDWILATDSENHTGEPIFDKLLDAPLALCLEQSPYVNVYSRASVRETLKRMRLDVEKVRIDEKVGLEICRRENLRAMLSASIYGAGGKYRLIAKIIDPSQDRTVKTIQVIADGHAQVVDKLDELAQETRRSLGETLSSIQKTNKKLAEVTTDSLEALRSYTDALEQQNIKNNIDAAIKLYQAAIDQDPNFASAYKSLASVYATQRQPVEARKFARAALERKDKLTEREAFHIQALYETLFDRYEPAIESYRILASRYPRDLTAHGNLGILYNFIGRFDRSLEEYGKVLEINPASALAYANSASAAVILGRYDQAIEYANKALQINPEDTLADFNLASAYLGKSDGDKARMHSEKMTAAMNPFLKVQGKERLAVVHIYAGRIAAAQRYLSDAVALCEKNSALGPQWESHGRRLRAALYEALGEKQALAPDLDRVVSLSDQTTGYLGLLNLAIAGKWYARSGRPDRARAALGRLEKKLETEQSPYNQALAELVRGEIELQRRDYPTAIAALRRAAEYTTRYDYLHVHESLAHAYFGVKDYDQAIREYEIPIKQKGWTLDYWTGLPHLWITAHYWLGRAYEEKAMKEQAVLHYQTFINLWQNSDTNVRPLADARRRLRRLP